MHPAPLVEVDEWFPACLAVAIVEHQSMGANAGISALPRTPLACVSLGVNAALVLAHYFPAIAEKLAYIAMGDAQVGVLADGKLVQSSDLLDTNPQLNRCGQALMIERAAELVAEARARSCRVCGCTDERACEGGCRWVEADLCSACVTPGSVR